MHDQESVLENQMLNILLEFEIQTNHLILARRPDLVIVKNGVGENLSNSGFCRTDRPQSKDKIKREKEVNI